MYKLTVGAIQLAKIEQQTNDLIWFYGMKFKIYKNKKENIKLTSLIYPHDLFFELSGRPFNVQWKFQLDPISRFSIIIAFKVDIPPLHKQRNNKINMKMWEGYVWNPQIIYICESETKISRWFSVENLLKLKMLEWTRIKEFFLTEDNKIIDIASQLLE